MVGCRYANDLPKPPVPKLLKALPAAERLYEYRPTSLELDHRPFLLSERDLISRIELVHTDAHGRHPAEGSMPPPPPPQDAQLLCDDDIPEATKEAERKRRRLTEHTEAWHRQAFGLQLPQLITNDVFTERQRFTTGLEAAEKKMHREPPGYKSAEDLARKIEGTFDAAREPPVHPTKPGMAAKRVLPVVPDAVLWANRYRQVAFDELPKNPDRNDLLFRTTPNPRSTCFAYFSPAEDGSYRLAQNYVWENRGAFTRANDIGDGEGILFSFPGPKEKHGEVRFVLVPTSLKLKKQKAQRLDVDIETRQLNVQHRDPSAQEAAEEQERMNVVLSDEVQRDHSEASLDYVDGDWQIRGDPRSQSATASQQDRSGNEPSSPLPSSPHVPARG